MIISIVVPLLIIKQHSNNRELTSFSLNPQSFAILLPQISEIKYHHKITIIQVISIAQLFYPANIDFFN